MSKENLEQFMNQISDSEELQARIGDEIDAESLIALGAEHGYEFTAEELQEAAELSDEELEGVAGGLIGENGYVASGGNAFFDPIFQRPSRTLTRQQDGAFKIIDDQIR